jgi:hypothetical protein
MTGISKNLKIILKSIFKLSNKLRIKHARSSGGKKFRGVNQSIPR